LQKNSTRAAIRARTATVAEISTSFLILRAYPCVPAIRCISRIRVHFVLGQSHVTALASFRQTLTQGTDAGARFLRMTKSKEELAMT
jgi:hypothetical protein